MNTQTLTLDLLHGLESKILGCEYRPMGYGQIKAQYGKATADKIQELRCGYAYYQATQAAQVK